MAPKTSQQFEEIRLKSQQKIEAAALELFAQKGFKGTSISQIAQKAGISKGLLYNYYENKEDLLQKIIEKVMVDGGAEIEEFLKSDLPAIQKLEAITEAAFQMVLSDINYWKLLTNLALQSDVMDSVKVIIEKQKDEMLVISRQLFTDLGFPEPEKEAQLYGAIMDGVLMQYLSLGDDYPLEEMKKYILSKYKNIANEK